MSQSKSYTAATFHLWLSVSLASCLVATLPLFIPSPDTTPLPKRKSSLPPRTRIHSIGNTYSILISSTPHEKKTKKPARINRPFRNASKQAKRGRMIMKTIRSSKKTKQGSKCGSFSLGSTARQAIHDVLFCTGFRHVYFLCFFPSLCTPIHTHSLSVCLSPLFFRLTGIFGYPSFKSTFFPLVQTRFSTGHGKARQEEKN
jgi:hypothetical protein